MRKTIAVCLLLLLCGCSKQQPSENFAKALRNTYDTLPGFTAQVKILSDLGQSTLEYGGHFEYNKKDSDKFTLETPDALAGVVITTTGETAENFTIQYADTILDTSMPEQTGFTPADVLPLLFQTIRTDAPSQIWSETTRGIRMVCARYETNDGSLVRQVWFARDSLRPTYAELYQDDKRILQVFFNQYEENQ